MKLLTHRRTSGLIGQSVTRPDGIPKATGEFAYLNDLTAEGMLWAYTRRAFLPRAQILKVDTLPAKQLPGVADVITIDQIPGSQYQGQDEADQPVLAKGEIRHWGEAVAVVVAEDLETARLAAEAIDLQLEPLPPQTDLETELAAGQVYREVHVRRGDPAAAGEVVVENTYQVGVQDQAPLGTEAGLAIPDGEGGVDLWGPSQWVYVDHEQLTKCLGVAPDQIRVHPGGLGGAFGAREDLSLQTHICLLALRTGRPIKQEYNRFDSFAGHVKRHAAQMWYRHQSDREGNLVRVDARLLFDGGAYQMTSAAVIGNASFFAVGPYRCPNTFVDGYSIRTNHPPSGAMRGFGANQVSFASERQMDQLAEALGVDPVALRLQNALAPGDRNPTTGQLIDDTLPTAEAIRSVAALPLPAESHSTDPRLLPGGTGLTTPPDRVRRGVGYGVAIKNIGFSEGFDDYAEARVELRTEGIKVHTAAVEVGQGMVTILAQIARTVLGIQEVEVVFNHTSEIGSAGSTSASRQTQMSGGAVYQAATKLKDRLLSAGQGEELNSEGVWSEGELITPLSELLDQDLWSEWVRFRHPPTDIPDENGQGNLHPGFTVAAHRAVVDVDLDLGLVRVVQVDIAQDVGKIIHPIQIRGQIEGGIAQGLGLAVMEELVYDQGMVANPTFTDYLLPTSLDMPPVEALLLEEPSSWGPFGAKGMAELPSISVTPAVVAAIAQATGKSITRVPVRPQDIACIEDL